MIQQLEGTYTAYGIRRWFQRPRAALDGHAPQELLQGHQDRQLREHPPAVDRKAASTGKPLVISTGMPSLGELDDAVRTARDAGCIQLVLLKCTSTYPASPDNTNIRLIPHLHELFGCEVGLSEYTMGDGVALAAVALGVTVIEKHFTLSRAEGGVDSSFSLNLLNWQSLCWKVNAPG